MRSLSLLLLALLPLAPFAARAEPKPDVRLLVAGVADGRVAAGLAVDLPEGWKTYWRTPGDAGIPPAIDTGASTGLTATVTYPAPERFDEAGYTAVGYTRSVVLPLEARLADPAKPGRLVVTVMIGLCHDVCVPFETRLEATVDPLAPTDAAAGTAIAAARRRVPRAAVPGEPPAIVAVRRDTGPHGPRLVAEVTMPAEAAARDVFVEGPSPDWALPQPEKLAEEGGRERWAFDLDGVPKGADLGAVDLRFTLTAGERAVEQIVRVDARPTAP